MISLKIYSLATAENKKISPGEAIAKLRCVRQDVRLGGLSLNN